MSEDQGKPGLTDRVAERPSLDLGLVRSAPLSGILIRFIAGAGTSVAAGLVTIAFGARVGGVPLAFPAILAASLTLIKRQQDTEDAREDARGAIVGGASMVIFAVIVALLTGHVAGGVVLAVAALAWLATALGAYAALWLR